MPDFDAVLGQECDKEPIHIPGAIQPFGVLLAISEQRVLWVSENCASLLALKESEILNRSIAEVLPGEGERLIAAAANRKEPTTPAMFRLPSSKVWITAIAFRVGSLTVIECERMPDVSEEIASLTFLQGRHQDLNAYLNIVADGVRRITGYDRVMVYKFAEDWHGEVVAESRRDALYSFLGHHFPASDIPEPARRLFTENWVRMIANVEYEPVALKSKLVTTPLDLTCSALRSVSPIHLQYLRNMDVGASFTMSIICDGRLWGLIACHHVTPKYLSAHTRSVCGLMAKMISSRVTQIEIATVGEARTKLSLVVRNIEESLNADGDLSKAINLNKKLLKELIACDGFNYFQPGASLSEGNGFDQAYLKLLVSELDKAGCSVCHTTNLVEEFKALPKTHAAGILAVKFGSTWLIWNRKETVRTITWAGNPNKPMSETLSPRSSFIEWRERLSNTCEAWHQSDLDLSMQIHKAMLSMRKGSCVIVEQPSKHFENELLKSIDGHERSLALRSS